MGSGVERLARGRNQRAEDRGQRTGRSKGVCKYGSMGVWEDEFVVRNPKTEEVTPSPVIAKERERLKQSLAVEAKILLPWSTPR